MTQIELLNDPIELVSQFAAGQEWYLRQTSANAVLADVPGEWGHYQLAAEWRSDLEVLQLDARFDFMIDERHTEQVCELLNILNKDLFFGHFQFSDYDQTILLRYRLALRGAGGATPEQIEDCVDIMLGQCERASPVIVQILFGKDIFDIRNAGLILSETLGQA